MGRKSRSIASPGTVSWAADGADPGLENGSFPAY